LLPFAYPFPTCLSYDPLHHPDLYSFPTRRSSDLIPPAIDETRPPARWLLFMLPVTYTWSSKALSAWRPAAIPAALVPPMRLRLRSEEHTSELQSRENIVCRLLLEKNSNAKTDVVC